MKSTERNEFVAMQERLAKLELAIGAQGLSFTQLGLTLGVLIGEFRAIMKDLVVKMEADQDGAAEIGGALRALAEGVSALALAAGATSSVTPPHPNPHGENVVDIGIGQEIALAHNRAQNEKNMACDQRPGCVTGKETPTG